VAADSHSHRCDDPREGSTEHHPRRRLVASGRPGSLQIRLVDPPTGRSRRLGALYRGFRWPVFEIGSGPVIVGVISWSPTKRTRAAWSDGVTPLTLYRDWIVQTAAVGFGAVERFQAKAAPDLIRGGDRFASENASNQESRAPFRFIETGL